MVPPVAGEEQKNVPDAKRFSVDRSAGLAGQYQVAYNPEENVLFVSGSYNHTKTHGTLCATIARINADTLQIEQTATLPVIPENNPELANLFQVQAAYGLAADNERGLLWTGGTRTNSVTAYSQKDLSRVWDSLVLEVEMLTPRELYVAPNGAVLVTGMGGYQVISAPIAEGERRVSPLQGEGPAMLLGPVADESRSLLYIPNIMRDEIWVVDMNTWELARKLPVIGGEDANTPVGVHGVEIDSTRGELYVSAQGREGKNGGLYVLSFEGEHLAYLPFGKMPTDILLDAERHLLYVADFGGKGEAAVAGGGTVTVINTLNRAIIDTVQVAPTRINHQVLLKDGSVIAVDKAGDYPAAEVPYVLDANSGEYYEAAEETRPGEPPRPIVRDGIAKVYMP